MCGIFGSTVFKNYEKLYDANKKRGNFSYGGMYTTKYKEIHIQKNPGVVDLTRDREFSDDYNGFLGHTRAPTSSSRDYSPITSHPFEDFYYVVAHNGVLENHKRIIEDYLPGHTNTVDSSVIPALISMVFEFSEEFLGDDQHESKRTAEIMALEQACNTLCGTFGCWIYSKLTGCTFLIRNGSTLYGNVDTGEFSSVKVTGLVEEELKEGTIYCSTTEGLAECGEFKSSSQFFL